MSNSCVVHDFPGDTFEITWLIFVNHKNDDTYECGQWDDGTWGARIYAKTIASSNELVDKVRIELENRQKKQKAAASSAKRQKVYRPPFMRRQDSGG